MSVTFKYDRKPSKDVAALIADMSPVFQGKNEDTVLKACLAVAILMQDPAIAFPKLIEGVQGASEWISLWLMETPSQLVN